MSLRQFCIAAQLDPSNWSKIERGIIPPPKDADTLERITQVLELNEDEKQKYYDAVAAARAEIPADLASDEKIVSQLPAFFRAIRERNSEELKQLVEAVREINTP